MKTARPRAPRILFCGGKNIGTGCLRFLIDKGYDVVGVFTNPKSDSQKGRWFASAGALARKNGIPVFPVKKINSPASERVIQKLAPDIIVLVYYDQILKSNIIRIPSRGCVNLHMALAEEYRGCYPTTWAVVNDEKRAGVTLHFVDEQIDTGRIIAQATVPIDRSDTGRSVYDKCTEAGIRLFKSKFPLFKREKVPSRAQKTTKKTRAYGRRDFPAHEIGFDRPGIEVYNHIRALLFRPFPHPYFMLGDKKVFMIEEDRLPAPFWKTRRRR